ncbi:MAG: ferrochelatase [Rhodospirillales bacterium]
MAAKLAVVLFNLGGPDRPEAVRPFLFNLFNDPAIIGAPGIVRRMLAELISWRRAPVAREIYAKIGGRSPLLEQTREQASALQNHLRKRGHDAAVFISMRYWHPRSDETAAAVAAYAPGDIVLLPLYPQFSTTTSGSAMADWDRAARAVGLSARTRAVCCYPTDRGFVTAATRLVRAAIDRHPSPVARRILFSAHGLPERVIAGGDPYQWQVEATVAAMVAALDGAAVDHAICYQSRVGPLSWIGPSLEEELQRAARDRVAVLIVPVAFVSEHSETLVELDIEYRDRASGLAVPGYARSETVGSAQAFVDGLAAQVEDALSNTRTPCAAGGMRICPASFGRCPCRQEPESSETERKDR